MNLFLIDKTAINHSNILFIWRLLARTICYRLKITAELPVLSCSADCRATAVTTNNTNLPVLDSIPGLDPDPLLPTAGIPQELVVRVDPLVNDPLEEGSGIDITMVS